MMETQSVSFTMASIAGMGGALLRDLETVMGGGGRRPCGLSAQVPKASMRGTLTKVFSKHQRGQKLYGVLQSCSRLYFYSSEMDTEPRGCLDLDKMDSCTIQKVEASPTCSTFEIADPNDPSLCLCFDAHTSEEADMWVHALSNDTHSRLKQDRDRLSLNCEMLRAEVEALEAHAHSVSQYAEHRQKSEEALKSERAASQDVAVSLTQASQHTRTALRTLSLFSQSQGLKLDTLSIEHSSGCGEARTPVQGCSRESEMCMKAARENELLSEKLRHLVCALMRVCEEKTRECSEYEELCGSYKEQVEMLQQELDQAKVMLHEQRQHATAKENTSAKCEKLRSQKAALKEEVKRLRLHLNMRDMCKSAGGNLSPTTVCASTPVGSIHPKAAFRDVDTTSLDRNMLTVNLNDVNNPRASFVYDSSLFRHSLKEKISVAVQLTTHVNANPYTYTETPSNDAEKFTSHSDMLCAHTPSLNTLLIESPTKPIPEVKPEPPSTNTCVYGRSQSAPELKNCLGKDIYTLTYTREKIGLRFGKKGDEIVVHSYHEIELGTRTTTHPETRLPSLGAVLLAFNDVNVEKLKFSDVANMLRQSGRPLSLTFREEALPSPALAKSTSRAYSVNNLLSAAVRVTSNIFKNEEKHESWSDTTTDTGSSIGIPPPTYIISDLEFAGADECASITQPEEDATASGMKLNRETDYYLPVPLEYA